MGTNNLSSFVCIRVHSWFPLSSGCRLARSRRLCGSAQIFRSISTNGGLPSIPRLARGLALVLSPWRDVEDGEALPDALVSVAGAEALLENVQVQRDVEFPARGK